MRGFYLPLASDSRAGDGPAMAATLSIMNTLNAEHRGTESLLVDGESDTVRLSYENSAAADWRYRFTVPIVHDGGGFLDSAIDSWHRLFGFSDGSRPYYPKNQLVYFYAGRDRIYVHDSATGIGALAAEAGWYAADSAERTISLWGGVQAPTGSVARLGSDGAWDAAFWGHAARRFAHWRLAAEIGLMQPFGDQLFAGAAHHAVGFARAAVTRDLGAVWSLRAQLDGRTGRVTGTQLRLLGPSLQITAGAVRQLHHRWRLEMGLAEDAAVNTAPDVTFFLGIHN